MSLDINLDDYEYANVKLGGQKHKIKLPSAEEQVDFEEGLRKFAEDEEAETTEEILSYMRAHVVGLGLPEDMAKKLNLYQIRALLKGVSGISEKK